MSVHKIAFHLAKFKRFLAQKMYSNLEYCSFVRPGPFQGTEIKVKEDRFEVEEVGVFWLIEGLKRTPLGFVAEGLFDFFFSVMLCYPVPFAEYTVKQGTAVTVRFRAGRSKTSHHTFSCSLKTKWKPSLCFLQQPWEKNWCRLFRF